MQNKPDEVVVVVVVVVVVAAVVVVVVVVVMGVKNRKYTVGRDHREALGLRQASVLAQANTNLGMGLGEGKGGSDHLNVC